LKGIFKEVKYHEKKNSSIRFSAIFEKKTADKRKKTENNDIHPLTPIYNGLYNWCKE